MKAITVKYLAQTNHRPARFRASDDDGNSIIVPSRRGDYREGAQALCKKMNWAGKMSEGQQKPGTHVFVFDQAGES